MDYSVGSLADLISGSNTPNKPSVIIKEFKKKTKENLQIDTGFNNFKGNKRKINNAPVDEIKQVPFKKSKKDKKGKKKYNKNHFEDVNVENKDENIHDISVNGESNVNVECKDVHGKSKINDENKKVKSKDKKSKVKKENSNVREGKLKSVKEVDSGSFYNAKEIDEKLALITKEHNKRTIFVGNLPLNINKNILKRFFEKFGRIDSVRLRSAPIADVRTPKKVAIIKKEFHKDRKSINAYIRYMEREDAIKATKLNGTEYKSHHIRVKLCDDEKPDQSKAIFLGNVCFDAEEEDLWKLFEPCGAIESVRLVRDRKTDVGKGFGYVNFKSADSVELALQMENVKLKNRELRISACVAKKTKKKESVKVEKPQIMSGNKNKMANSGKDYQGKIIAGKKKKKFNKGDVQKKKLIRKIAPKPLKT